jgi:thioredoxin reductase (NADPH)
VLVGGGNSAGQAAVFLAEHVAKVWMLVRRADIASHVALSGRPGQRNVEVVPQTEVCALEGVDGTHQEVVLVGGANSAGQAAVFLFVYEKCEQIRRGSDNPKSRKKP